MAEIRLNKLTKQFNIGLQTLVDFLNGKGANLNLDPNVKVSDEYLPELEKAFGKDLKAKEDSEKVRIKIKEIIEKDTKKKEEDEDEPSKETVIIRTGLSSSPASQPEDAAVQEPAVAAETAGPEIPAGQAAVDGMKAEPEEAEPVVDESPAAPVQAETAEKPEAAMLGPEPVREPEILPENTEAQEHVAAQDEDEEKNSEDRPSAPTPAEAVAAAPALHKSDLKKSDRNIKDFNPKADKAKLKAEHKLQKAASSKEDDTDTASTGLKIVGKVDLSQFETGRKNKKRERINKGGSQKVDVNKIDGEDKGDRKDQKKNRGGNQAGQGNGKKDQRQNNGQQGQGKAARRKERMNEKFKPALTAAEE